MSLSLDKHPEVGLLEPMGDFLYRVSRKRRILRGACVGLDSQHGAPVSSCPCRPLSPVFVTAAVKGYPVVGNTFILNPTL